MKQILISVLTSITLAQCVNQLQKEKLDTYQKLTPEENQKWVDNNLDRVMEARVFEASNGMSLPYRIFIEGGGEQQQMPLLIHLHGRGERGTDNTSKTYNNIPLFNGSSSIVSPNGQYKYPCVVLVPQCSDKTINEEWARWEGNTPETPWEGLGEDGSYMMAEAPSISAESTLELIDHIITSCNIDVRRVYITGLSMGGFGTWEFIGRRPDLFAAAIPMAGYSDRSTVGKIKHIPTWIFHGEIDKYNPVQGSRDMYQSLKKAGANVKYTEYSNTGHGDTFQRAWEDSTLLSWVFQQKRQE